MTVNGFSNMRIIVPVAVGFDCEWVFSGKRLPVALIQIATYDGFCVLIQIHKFTCIPSTLRHFLGDKSILKLGVASKEDGKKLHRDYGIVVEGCVDLRYIVGRLPALKCTAGSLQALADRFLGVKMKKDRNIRCGDWQAELTQAQIDYAADDALFGMDIFLQLVALKVTGRSVKDSRYFGQDVCISREEFWNKARALCQGITDVTYKGKTAGRVMAEVMCSSSEDDEYLDDSGSVMSPTSFSSLQSHKSSKNTKAFMTRQRPLYYNCKLLAPDGECLTLCDIRKAQWYIDKELGDKVSDDPFTVKLRFEPKNRPASRQDYYLQEKENTCVVCGSHEDYVRKLVVPQEYRKYFPPILKNHSSHDVLLLCIQCHLRCADYETAVRQRLVAECDAPLDSGKDSKRRLDGDLAKVVSAAKALLKSKGSIPEDRLQDLEAMVKTFYGVKSLPAELLEEAVSMETRVNNSSFVPHGKKVVDFYMQKHGGLLEFERMWRRHFLESMQPKYLPALWSVEHQPERLKPVTEDVKHNIVLNGLDKNGVNDASS
ncbi:exonuclease 3'-5' domain-containing protein 2-like isoform X2 [Dreissena polymorpha]|uniref:exonuclease 3'-5' domain-containing protein 2-like isoform X2 n=1 Tax=Dreissena polymorpha TaxID=45954 RepID=UPI002263E5E4|nr:exonuclease 3'-5' domain-containing protein 2-like isoform X2 [Dreissena polymorpha]